MPADHLYPAMVALIVFATVTPAFMIGRFGSPLRLLIGYLVGLVCGVAALRVEINLINVIKYDDLFFVALLPAIGIAVAWIWPAASVRQTGWKRRSLGIALLILVGAFVYDVVNTQPAHAEVPFEAGTKGSAVEVQFRVGATYPYSFFLDFHFKEGDRDDRARVHRLAGEGGYDRDGRPVRTGLAIPVRLVVQRIGGDGSKPVIDGVFTNHELHGHAADRYSKRIVRARLEPGRYRARIEALENVEELAGVPVVFAIRIPGNE